MKKLLLTTAVLTIGVMGGNSYAFADSAQTLTQVEFTKMYESIKTTSFAKSLHNGDFQALTRAENQNQLYKGAGSSLMGTVRIGRC